MPPDNVAAIVKRLREGKAAKSPDSLALALSEQTQDTLSGLNEGRRAAVAQRLAQMPETARKRYIRAVGGKSLRAAVGAQCMECVGWVRAEVRGCTALACPLYAYRPFSKKEAENGAASSVQVQSTLA